MAQFAWGLPATFLGDTYCSGKIPNNLFRASVSLFGPCSPYSREASYFEGRGLKPDWSEHQCPWLSSLSETSSTQARKLTLHLTSTEAAAQTCRPWGRQWQGALLWNTGLLSGLTRGLSASLLIRLWNRSRKGLYLNLCRLNSILVGGSNPGMADIIWLISREDSLRKTRKARILCGTRWGEDWTKGCTWHLNVHLSQPPFLCKSKWDLFLKF